MSTPQPRYYIELTGEDYQQRFLVDPGARFASYSEDERLEHMLILAEDHLDYLSEGRADRRPVFLDRTWDDPPETGYHLVVDEVTFWPMPR
jgi:hypothetical protein